MAAGGTTVCLFLIVSCRSLAWRSFAFVLPAVRVFIHRIALLFCLLGRVSVVAAGPRPLFVPVLPVPCVSYCVLAFRPPRLIRRVRLCRRPLSDCPRLVDSVAVPCHPIDAVPCFSPSVSAFRFFPRFFPLASHPLCAPCVSPSLLGSSPFPVPPCLVVSRPDCRSACFALPRSRVGLAIVRSSCGLPRSALRPALLVGGRGGLLCRGFLSSRAARCLKVPFLVVARSSGADCLVPCPSPVVLACFPASVSCGVAAAVEEGAARVWA